jgi:hypothetical protein
MRFILLALFTTFPLYASQAVPQEKAVYCSNCEILKKQMDAYNEKISAIYERHQPDPQGIEGCMNSLDANHIDDLQKLHDQLAVEYNAHCGQKLPQTLWQGLDLHLLNQAHLLTANAKPSTSSPKEPNAQ